MTNIHTRSLRAATAISAVLALGSTPALGQDAAPSLDLPTVPSQQTSSAPPPSDSAMPGSSVTAPQIILPAPPAPTIVLPQIEAAPPAAEPQPATNPPQAREAQAPASARANSSQTRVAERQASVRSEARAGPVPALQGDGAETLDSPDPALAGIIPAPVGSQSDPTVGPEAGSPVLTNAEDEQSGGVPDAALAALLGLLGLGAAGYLGVRSRRRSRVEDEEPALVASTAISAGMAPQEPVLAAERDPALVPAMASAKRPGPQRYDFTGMPVRDDDAQAKPAMFAVPDGPLPDGAERQALIRRMVEAQPDETNPFTSPRARRRRARMILARQENLQRQSADETFDWRTYKSAAENPSKADPAPVTA